MLVPVGACLGRALLGFKVNVEEAVTLVVAIGPGELILQAPQEVATHVDAHLHGLEQPAQVLLDVVDARLVVHKAVLVGILVAHAVFGDEDLLVVGVALLNVDEQIEQALGIDDPVPVGGGDAGLVHMLADALDAPAAGALFARTVVVQVVLAIVSLEEAALVIVDTQVVVVERCLAHNLEILVQDLDGAARDGSQAVGALEGVGRVVAAEGGVEQELVLQHVLVVGGLDVGGVVLVERVLELQRLDDADLALKAAVVEGQHGLGVGEHHVVLALEGLGQMSFDATGEGALDVGVGGVRPDLVKGEPISHLVGVLLKAEGGKVHKGVDGLAVEEVALLKEGKRRVKVMQRDKRLNVVLVALGEEIVVELDALGVDLAGAVGEDAAPGNGEANAVDAELLAQLQIDGVLVVEVGGGIGGEAALGLQEVVPGDLALTVGAGFALYLVGSGGAAKDKVLGKLRRRVGDASRVNGHDDPIV